MPAPTQTQKLLNSLADRLADAQRIVDKLQESSAEDRLAKYHDDDLVPDGVARAIFGRTRQTFWRWEREPDSGFPKAIKVNGRKSRKAGDLRRFRDRLESS